MTAKEYLSQLRHLKIRMISNANEIESLTDVATSITSAINNDGIQTTGATSDKLGNCVARIIDMQNQIIADTDRLEELRVEIVARIDLLDNPKYRDLLMLRYVNDMTFEEIADTMDCTRRWITKLHGRALHEFSTKFKIFLRSS